MLDAGDVGHHAFGVEGLLIARRKGALEAAQGLDALNLAESGDERLLEVIDKGPGGFDQFRL